MHRLLVRSLYRIWQEDDFIPASTNFELSGLLRLVCDHYSVNKDYQITERNKRWVAHALACRNPFSDVQHGYELTIITPERQSGNRRVAVLDLGFDLLKIVADFRKEAKFVARQRRLQKRQIDREFEVLTAQTGRRGSSNSSRANRARVRQAKERIKELWLNHPDKAIRDRLFVVCNAIGGSLEGQGGFLPTVDPFHVETLHTRALIFFMDENYTACEEDLQHILSIENRHFPSLQTLYRLHQALGSKSGMLEALDKFRRAVPRDPDLEAMHHEAMAMTDGEQIGSGPSAGSLLQSAGATKTSASSTKNADAVVVGGEISDEVDVAPKGDPVSAAVIEKQDGNGTDGGSRNTTRRGP
eukprot:g5680.t1